jgi:hypothetical protein
VLAPGNLDKQPEMVGLMPGCGYKLYGGGGADDGYAIFGALSALRHWRSRKRAKQGDSALWFRHRRFDRPLLAAKAINPCPSARRRDSGLEIAGNLANVRWGQAKAVIGVTVK